MATKKPLWYRAAILFKKLIKIENHEKRHGHMNKMQ
jgi:hypothetical protein